ncbi:MAG: cation transporter [Casimicrobium sp.]
MSAHCNDHSCSDSNTTEISARYRKVLWIALIVNATMFVVEIVAGIGAQSASLLADAVDFFGDALNYGMSIVALGLLAVWRSRVAYVKGVSMGIYGVGVVGFAGWNAASGVVPEAKTMGIIGTLALAANVSVALLLYRYREGDANMRSVWLCTRNDAIGNVAVVLAALGVLGSGTGWPDFIVAALMGVLAISATLSVVRRARLELATQAPAAVNTRDHVH